jgi:hypothetical protein
MRDMLAMFFKAFTAVFSSIYKLATGGEHLAGGISAVCEWAEDEGKYLRDSNRAARGNLWIEASGKAAKLDLQ